MASRPLAADAPSHSDLAAREIVDRTPLVDGMATVRYGKFMANVGGSQVDYPQIPVVP